MKEVEVIGLTGLFIVFVIGTGLYPQHVGFVQVLFS
jgi:hypothetical protein